MSRTGILFLGLVLGLGFAAHPAHAEKINCANEFRSGKLYFSQATKDKDLELYGKSVDRFQLAVETCPDKPEYRARYGMALAQLAATRLEEELITLPTPEEREALIDSVLALYELAGGEFDSSSVLDDSKSNLKFVRENREYFWVQRYNGGLKRLKEEEYEGAILEFRMALLVDPNSTLQGKNKSTRNSKAYSQGAIAFINMDQKGDAAKWVETGLKVDPEDEKLNELLETIFVDAGRELTDQAKADKDLQKAQDAAEYFSKVLERRGGEDPDILFDLGLSYLAGGMIAEGDTAKEMSLQAAAAFGKAAELVPPGENEQNTNFHLAALFNEAQGLMDAENFPGALAVCRSYIALDCDDPSIWLMTAQAHSSTDDQTKAVAALMASKSIQGEQLAVEDAKQNAQGDEAASASELGDPNLVFSYQDSQQNQVNTWIWCEKRTLQNFILGEKVGELTWGE